MNVKLLWTAGWAARRGFRRWRERRRAKKAAKRAETTSEHIEIRFEQESDMGFLERFRTSTKAGAAGVVTFAAIEALGYFFPEFPTTGLEEWVPLVIAYFAARFSRTPAKPGKL